MTQTVNNDLTKTISDVKRDIMFHIILNMRHFKITMQDAQNLAQDLLKIFPVSTMEDLLTKLRNLGTIYEEVRIVFIKYAVPYYEEQKNNILRTVPGHIQKQEYDTAIKLLKGVTYHG